MTDPGGFEPPALVMAKDYILKESSKHQLTGLVWTGIAPGAPRNYGYHNSAARHLAGFTTSGTSDYSIRQADDKVGNRQHFSAIDLGTSSELGRRHTRIMTARMRDAVAKGDPRVSIVREFYGSLDNSVVFGRTHTSATAGWVSASADMSHLWHLHVSFFRRYTDDTERLMLFADVILGIPAGGTPKPPPAPEEPASKLVADLIKELERVQKGMAS